MGGGEGSASFAKKNNPGGPRRRKERPQAVFEIAAVVDKAPPPLEGVPRGPQEGPGPDVDEIPGGELEGVGLPVAVELGEGDEGPREGDAADHRRHWGPRRGGGKDWIGRNLEQEHFEGKTHYLPIDVIMFVNSRREVSLGQEIRGIHKTSEPLSSPPPLHRPLSDRRARAPVPSILSGPPMGAPRKIAMRWGPGGPGTIAAQRNPLVGCPLAVAETGTRGMPWG